MKDYYSQELKKSQQDRLDRESYYSSKELRMRNRSAEESTELERVRGQLKRSQNQVIGRH